MLFKKKDDSFRDLIIAYKRVFATPDGKVVLYDLMSRYHVLNPHDGDPMKEGERKVVLGILRNCNISITELDEMLKPQGDI